MLGHSCRFSSKKLVIWPSMLKSKQCSIRREETAESARSFSSFDSTLGALAAGPNDAENLGSFMELCLGRSVQPARASRRELDAPLVETVLWDSEPGKKKGEVGLLLCRWQHWFVCGPGTGGLLRPSSRKERHLTQQTSQQGGHTQDAGSEGASATWCSPQAAGHHLTVQKYMDRLKLACFRGSEATIAIAQPC